MPLWHNLARTNIEVELTPQDHAVFLAILLSFGLSLRMG